MDIDVGSLALSFLVSGIGFVLFSYGRRMTRGPQMLVGIVLMGFPYFVDNLLLVGLIAIALLSALYAALRLGW
jgi:hypothetical protein